MSDALRPDEVEEEQSKGGVVAGLVRQHYEALMGVGFEKDEAFELSSNYHWFLLIGEEPEEA